MTTSGEVERGLGNALLTVDRQYHLVATGLEPDPERP